MRRLSGSACPCLTGWLLRKHEESKHSCGEGKNDQSDLESGSLSRTPVRKDGTDHGMASATAASGASGSAIPSSIGRTSPLAASTSAAR